MFGFSFGPKSVSVVEANTARTTPNHCLLDVRTREEYREGHAAGAINIPLHTLESRLGQLAKYESIHVMCRSGGRSAQGTMLLNQAGFPHALNVTGGIMAWEAAGLPTE